MREVFYGINSDLAAVRPISGDLSERVIPSVHARCPDGFLRVSISIERQNFLVFIDIGSTHTFVSATLVQRLNLPIFEKENYEVLLADISGKKLTGFRELNGRMGSLNPSANIVIV